MTRNVSKHCEGPWKPIDMNRIYQGGQKGRWKARFSCE